MGIVCGLVGYACRDLGGFYSRNLSFFSYFLFKKTRRVWFCIDESIVAVSLAASVLGLTIEKEVCLIGNNHGRKIITSISNLAS